MDLARCGSHERIADTVKRVEDYLDRERKDNQEFRLYMTKALSAIGVKLQEITDIKATQVTNIAKREQAAVDCEDHREKLWEEINGIKERHSEEKGFIAGIAIVGGVVGASLDLLIRWVIK